MICREFHCLFVHIPKTAGQSIEQFFMSKLGLDWEAGREHLLLGRNTNTACGTEKLAHLSASEYTSCGYLGEEEFNRYFRFSFVRNPWDRLVSEYRYRNYFSHRSFRHFVLNRFPTPGWSDQYRHVMPQYDMLFDSQDRQLVDFVGRFENLQEDFRKVCEYLEITDSTLPHRNPSDKQSRNLRRRLRNWLYLNGENRKENTADFYDPETIRFVSEYYQRDIEVFGYPQRP